MVAPPTLRAALEHCCAARRRRCAALPAELTRDLPLRCAARGLAFALRQANMADESKTPEWKLKGPLSLDQFDLGVTLGTGSFGRVRFVTHGATRTHWAMKMLKKHEVIRLQQVDHMLSEKAILAVLNHPFIVKLAGTFQGTCAADARVPRCDPRPRARHHMPHQAAGRRCTRARTNSTTV